jgi:hypothetical protein
LRLQYPRFVIGEHEAGEPCLDSLSLKLQTLEKRGQRNAVTRVMFFIEQVVFLVITLLDLTRLKNSEEGEVRTALVAVLSV